MNKNELISVVTMRTNMPKKDIKNIIYASLDTIQETLAAGHSVQMQGFGSFSVRARALHRGRNPQTGKPMDIPASKSAVFKAGAGLKAAIQG